MSFLSLTERDREEMLATIGVASIDELFRDLPQAVRFGRELDLEPALSEQEVEDRKRRWRDGDEALRREFEEYLASRGQDDTGQG